jgi:hypothetical protein
MKEINNCNDQEINRGIELMLRRRKKEIQPELNKKMFDFEKLFSFFQREFLLKIELSEKKK